MMPYHNLEPIDNGSLHTTVGIYPVPEPKVMSREFSSYRIKQFDYYCSILNNIGDELVAGDEIIIDKVNHYENLRLTKKSK